MWGRWWKPLRRITKTLLCTRLRASACAATKTYVLSLSFSLAWIYFLFLLISISESCLSATRLVHSCQGTTRFLFTEIPHFRKVCSAICLFCSFTCSLRFFFSLSCGTWFNVYFFTIRCWNSLCRYCYQPLSARIAVRGKVKFSFKVPRVSKYIDRLKFVLFSLRNNEVQFAGELQSKGCFYSLKFSAGDQKVVLSSLKCPWYFIFFNCYVHWYSDHWVFMSVN